MSDTPAPAAPAPAPEQPAPPATLAEIRRQLGWGLIPQAQDADRGE